MRAEAFFDTLSSVDLGLVALAICCHLLKFGCVEHGVAERARRRLPEAARPVPLDPRRLRRGRRHERDHPGHAPATSSVSILTHRAIPGATYTTLVSSTGVLAIVDMTLAGLLFLWALTQGLLPSADSLPNLPGFDFGWLFDNPVAAQILVLAAVLGADRASSSGRATRSTTSGTASARRSPSCARRGAGCAPSSRGSSATGRCGSRRSGSSSARSASTSRSAMRCSSR